MGLFLGTVVHDMEKVIVVATIVMLTLLLVGGFFVTNIPTWLAWLKFLSPFQYSYEAGMSFQYDVGRDGTTCDGSFTIPACVGQPVGTPLSGDEVLDHLGVSSRPTALNVGMLFVLFVVLRLGAYLALRFLGRNAGAVRK